MYIDSDWGSDKDTQRSTTGVLVMMTGRPVNWISKLQPIRIVSSMDAEYLAIELIHVPTTELRADFLTKTLKDMFRLSLLKICSVNIAIVFATSNIITIMHEYLRLPAI